MSHVSPSTSNFQSTKRISQGAVRSEFQQQSPHTTSIHILDDYSLLNIFFLHRPFLLGEDGNDEDRLKGGSVGWAGEHWWFKLTHVCRRWRNLVLGAASYLGLCLVCTYGTPVADMLAHSLPLPLVIDYEGADITAEDEEAIILALEQRDRVRRIRFNVPVLKLQKIIMAIDGEYPILEYLILLDPHEDSHTVLILPETLQTPHLRHLAIDCSIPIRFHLLMTAVGLVTLVFGFHHPPTYIQPTVLLQCLSLMPQLENLMMFFCAPVPNRDVERQLTRTPIVTHVTLPNLRFFTFQGVSAYSEALLGRITAPRLETFHIRYRKQLTFSVPQLLQFMGRAENLRFDRAEFNFYSERVCVEVGHHETNMSMTPFSVDVNCWHLDWQVSSVAQIFRALSQRFSAVEHLTFAHKVHSRSSEEHNEVDRTEWRKLLRSFSNAKTLQIDHGLVKELSRCLQLDDGEHPLELLPELQELTYSGSGNANDAFTSFIEARRNAGRPVALKFKSTQEHIPTGDNDSDSDDTDDIHGPWGHSPALYHWDSEEYDENEDDDEDDDDDDDVDGDDNDSDNDSLALLDSEEYDEDEDEDGDDDDGDDNDNDNDNDNDDNDNDNSLHLDHEECNEDGNDDDDDENDNDNDSDDDDDNDDDDDDDDNDNDNDNDNDYDCDYDDDYD